MDIYIKRLGEPPMRINHIDKNSNTMPLLMDKDAIEAINWFEHTHQYHILFWEVEIVNQINENKYGWFDPNKSLIDIGAGIGEYPIFSNFRHCYAFEPNRSSRYIMCANAVVHDKIDNIDIYPYAISDNPGTRGFTGWTEDVESGADRLSLGESDQIVEYRTLDSFNFNDIGLIKADIEGFEYNALRSGMGTIIRNDYPPILAEMWSDYSIENDFWRYDTNAAAFYKSQEEKLRKLLSYLGYVRITGSGLGDWETYFFIHETHLNGYDGDYVRD